MQYTKRLLRMMVKKVEKLTSQSVDEIAQRLELTDELTVCDIGCGAYGTAIHDVL